jgi:2,3-dihydroxyphenylpropionate 1,2-dioxygenase
MSHSPLFGLNPVEAAVRNTLDEAIGTARQAVHAFDPQLVVLVGPDHYNGFFNELMPPFCIGSAATSVGDYRTPAGTLNVDGDAALALTAHLMDAGFDMALSRRMTVDHGFAQAVQFLWGDALASSPPIVPIFQNAVAQPGIPRLARCHALGQEIGRFLDQRQTRTLVIGSGGLSHEPPVPTLKHPDEAVRERITVRQEPTAAQRDEKTRLVMAAGMALASGQSGMKPLNPDWDRRWMDVMQSGDFSDILGCCEDSIEALAGLSAHESKTWLVARAALGEHRATRCTARHYQAIPEFIAGYGILFVERV